MITIVSKLYDVTDLFWLIFEVLSVLSGCFDLNIGYLFTDELKTWTHILEHDNRDPFEYWTHLLKKYEPLSQKGLDPKTKKAEILGQAHVADRNDKKMITKKAKLIGSAHVEHQIGPG